MASYIDQLKKANPEAYKKLEGLMAYSANEAYGGVPQDYQAQILTNLDTSNLNAPKNIGIGKYIDAPTYWTDEQGFDHPTGGTRRQWIQGTIPKDIEAVYQSDNDSPNGVSVSGYTKNLGTINGVPVNATYDLQGNLTGYSGDQRYRNWLNGNQSVSGRWDAEGKAIPAQYTSGGGGFFSGLAGGLGDLVGGVADAFGDLASSDLGKLALVGAGAYYGLPALAGEGAAGAGTLTGYDAAMADLAASTPAFTGAEVAAGAGATDALAADNIDMGGGWNPAGGVNGVPYADPATAAAAAETGVTSSALTPHYEVPTADIAPIPDDATYPKDYVPPTAEPSTLDKLAQLAKDNPLTTAGLAALAAGAATAPEQPAAVSSGPPTYNMNPFQLQRTYNTPEDAVGKQYVQGQNTGERNWVTDTLVPQEAYVKTEGKAAGGRISSHEGLMNLHHTADDLAAQGRYGDDTLVHMNRDEVAGLQALAQQHGKTLHTNPNTGYPEAFSLKQELGNATSGVGAPILGAGISVLSGGAIDPMTAAAIVGGTQAVASGNLQKGLMSGLGAWGGASLGAGFSSIGQSAVGADAYKAANALGMEPEAIQSAVSDKIANTGTWDTLKAGATSAMQDPKAALAALGSGSAWKGAGVLGAAAAPFLANQMVQTATPAPTQSPGLIRPYQFNRKVITPTDMVQPSRQQGQSTRERNWFEDTLTANTPYEAPGEEYKKMAGGGPVEAMSNANAVGANTGYPQADITGHAYATPWQTPVSQNVVQGTPDTGVNRMSGQMLAQGGIAYAAGGLPSLGGYASGGNPRLLKGPGDGMSDNIPAVIGDRQPARLADGEFVVPADVVSHLGNGSTEAGAKQLYKMMDRIRQQRTGKKRQAPEINPKKALPA